MKNIKLTIEYDGTHFKGWQIQGKGERTVQSDIQRVLSKILNEKITLVGSGRTDSGVHAKGQVANFNTKSKLPLSKIQHACNSMLKDDVRILKTQSVGSKFHAQYSAKAKTYRYTITNNEMGSAHQRLYAWHVHYDLDVARMRRAAKVLLGKHDFRSFQAADKLRKDKDTVRTIKRIEIKRKNDVISIDIEANGFLYRMVRNIVGTLVAIGSGQLRVKDMQVILQQKDRNVAGDTAKAQGLCLLCVKY